MSLGPHGTAPMPAHIQEPPRAGAGNREVSAVGSARRSLVSAASGSGAHAQIDPNRPLCGCCPKIVILQLIQWFASGFRAFGAR